MKLLRRIIAKSRPALVAGVGLVLGLSAHSAFAAPDITVSFLPIPPKRLVGSLTMSADGRFVAYKSPTEGMGGNTGDIYLIDRIAGTTTQANLTLSGTVPSNPRCDMPAISGNGRYIVFACNAVAMGAAAAGDGYFVYDRVKQKTEVVALVNPGTIFSGVPAAISSDGHYVAYRVNLGPSSLGGTKYSIRVRNMVSKTTTDTTADSVSIHLNPAPLFISSDGRYVSYEGRAIPSSNASDCYVYDLKTGVTEQVNVSSTGAHQTPSPSLDSLSMSDDGMVFTFRSISNVLVPNGGGLNVYLRDRSTGKTESISGYRDGLVYAPRISGNGRYVSYFGNPVKGGTYNLQVYDRLTKLTRTVPGITTGGANFARAQTFSADGRYLVFENYTGSPVTRSIGIVDLGAAAGLNLSSDKLSLTEGGAAATYSAVLAQVPDADVTVAMTSGPQLSLSPAQLTFTSENWSVPQLVSAKALNDGIAQGPHASSIKHTVSSDDIAYTVVKPATVVATINDGVIPTIATPPTPWSQTQLALTGTAAPGATVMLTAINRSTGWQTSVTAVADAQGQWSYTLFGLTDGVLELDVQADGIKGAVVTITVALPKPVPDPTNPGGPVQPSV